MAHILLVLAVLLLPATASADAPSGAASRESEVPPALVDRQLTLPGRTSEVAVGLGPGDERTDSFNLLTLSHGLTDTVTLSATAGTTMRRTGTDWAYRTGAGLTWSLARSAHQDLAVRVGAAFGTEVPDTPDNTFFGLGTSAWSGWAGLGYKLSSGRVGLYAGARLDSGLTRRDLGNLDRGALILRPELQITSRLAGFLGAGVAVTTPHDGTFLGGRPVFPVNGGVLWAIPGAPLRGLDVGATLGISALSRASSSQYASIVAMLRI